MNWLKKHPLPVLILILLATLACGWLVIPGKNNDLLTGVWIGITYLSILLVLVMLLAHATGKRREGDALAKARPVDPDNPPSYQTMICVPGDIETPCTCHGRPLGDGETILRWPHPDDLLCEETHKNGEL
ncbi:hypothetical protein E6R60_26345 [Streptomyces sp. A0642]|uniref:hypothetical protein n=1 Tax=Streptomyces sp. A0642 TaxID=2563100 RepID=UPI0010A24907|nr:hypothetical protein [Streptomyces sp. A0642]THA72455.1 hypothetical protein E6R60_26345 [Streptomyces sp. A0642]